MLTDFFLSQDCGHAQIIIIMGTNDASSNVGEGAAVGPIAAMEDDHADWGQFLEAHRTRLRRMVALRLDQRLRGRIDPSDVIQEAFIEATERRPECVRQADVMPPFLWLRLLTLQRLHLVHRRQLGTKSRFAGARYRFMAARFPRRVRRHWRRCFSARHQAERSRHSGRTQATIGRGPRQHGPDRPRGAGPSPLRTAS